MRLCTTLKLIGEILITGDMFCWINRHKLKRATSVPDKVLFPSRDTFANLLFFPMWIEQILQLLFVAKAFGSVAFVSVSFFAILVSIVFKLNQMIY